MRARNLEDLDFADDEVIERGRRGERVARECRQEGERGSRAQGFKEISSFHARAPSKNARACCNARAGVNRTRALCRRTPCCRAGRPAAARISESCRRVASRRVRRAARPRRSRYRARAVSCRRRARRVSTAASTAAPTPWPRARRMHEHLGDIGAMRLIFGCGPDGLRGAEDVPVRIFGDHQRAFAARHARRRRSRQKSAAFASVIGCIVEHERRRLVRGGEDLLDRERDAAHLAAGRDPRQRPRRLAGVRGEAVDDLVDARSHRTRPRRRRSRPPARRGRPVAGRATTSKTPAGKPSSSSTPPTSAVSAAGGRPPRAPTARSRGRGDRDEQPRLLRLARRPLPVEAAQPLRLGRGPLAVGDDRGLVVAVAPLEGEDRRRAAPRAWRARPGRGRRPPPARAPRRRRPSTSASRPASRSASGSNRGSRRASAAGLAQRRSRRRRGRRRPRPSSASWSVAAPRAIASPCWAASSAAADLRGLAGSQARGGDLGRLVLAELEPAGELARVELELGERRPVRPPAIDGVGHRRAQRRRGPPNASSRSRCQRSSSSRCWSCWPWISTSGADHVGEPRRGHRLVVEPGGRAAAGGDLADGDQRLRQPVEQRRRPGPPPRRGGRASCRPGRRSPARGHRSAGSCRRRSRR